MLALQDLKPPKLECWINVYDNGKYLGFKYNSKEACEKAYFWTDPKAGYRLHVVMK